MTIVNKIEASFHCSDEKMNDEMLLDRRNKTNFII